MKMIIVGVELILASYFDIRYLAIPKWYFYIMAAVHIIYLCMNPPIVWWSYLASMCLGILLLLIGRITKESIGYGDGLMILLLGMIMDLQNIVCLFMLTTTVIGLGGLFLCMMHKTTRKQAIPMMPVLGIAYFLQSVLQIRSMD